MSFQSGLKEGVSSSGIGYAVFLVLLLAVLMATGVFGKLTGAIGKVIPSGAKAPVA